MQSLRTSKTANSAISQNFLVADDISYKFSGVYSSWNFSMDFQKWQNFIDDFMIRDDFTRSEYMAVKSTGLLSRLEPHLNWGHISHNVLPTNSTTTASNIVFITKSSTCNCGMNTITSCFCLESTVTAQQQNDDNESGQVPLSDPLSEVLRPKFGLRPDLSQNFTWRRRFGLRIFLDRIWVLARC